MIEHREVAAVAAAGARLSALTNDRTAGSARARARSSADAASPFSDPLAPSSSPEPPSTSGTLSYREAGIVRVDASRSSNSQQLIAAAMHVAEPYATQRRIGRPANAPRLQLPCRTRTVRRTQCNRDGEGTVMYWWACLGSVQDAQQRRHQIRARDAQPCAVCSQHPGVPLPNTATSRAHPCSSPSDAR